MLVVNISTNHWYDQVWHLYHVVFVSYHVHMMPLLAIFHVRRCSDYKTNGRRQFKSHRRTYLRRAADISGLFCSNRNQLSFTRGLITTICDHGDLYRYFKPNHGVFLTLTMWFLCARNRREIQKNQPKHMYICNIQFELICGFFFFFLHLFCWLGWGESLQTLIKLSKPGSADKLWTNIISFKIRPRLTKRTSCLIE